MIGDVSVYILSYNRGAFLREALGAVLVQTLSPKEIVVLDNGSKPDVYDSVKDLLGEKVRWCEGEGSHSALWNFRRAVQLATTKYVVVLHDDDRISEEFLATNLKFLEGHPEVGVVTCNGYSIDARGVRNGDLLRDDVVVSAVELYKSDTDVALIYAKESCLPFASAVYRNEVLQKVPMRDEFEKVVDAVFFCDLALHTEVAFLGRPLYEFRQHQGQDSSSFPEDAKNRLDEYLWTRTTNSNKVDMVRKAIIRRYTFEVMLLLLKMLKGQAGPGALGKLAKMIFDKRFRSREMILRISKKIFKFSGPS